MQLSCPKCDRELPRGDIDFAGWRAVCVCGAETSLDVIADRPGGGAAPPGLLCVEQGRARSWSWLLSRPRGEGVAMLLFASAWWGALVLTAWAPARGDLGARLFAALVLLVVGTVALYIALRMVLNRTRVLLDDRRFSLREGPVPARGSIDEPIANVERFEPAERSRDIHWKGAKNLPYPTLRMHRRSGQPIVLQLTLRSAEEARWLAGRWNRALADVQRPVVPATYRG
jgi:hypothetical protein